MFSSRLGCSSISFRHPPLPEALRTMRGIGFQEIDPAPCPRSVIRSSTCWTEPPASNCGAHLCTSSGCAGHFSLELETRDVTHEQRPAAARAAAEHLSSLL